MVIKALMTLVRQLLLIVLRPIKIISMPATIATVFGYVITLFASGVGIVAHYTHFEYICILLGVIISVNAFISGYRLIMWILKKIPFLNIH